MLTGFFQDSHFIVVLQIGFGPGSGFLPLGQDWSRIKKNWTPKTSGLPTCCVGCIPTEISRFRTAYGLLKIGLSEGVRKGGEIPPLSLIFCKIFITCAKEIKCFRIFFAY